MNNVPRDIWDNVFKHLDRRETARASIVCKDFRRAGLYRAEALRRLRMFFRTWEFETMTRGRWPRIIVFKERDTDYFIDKFRGARTVIAYDGFVFVRTRSLLSKPTRST